MEERTLHSPQLKILIPFSVARIAREELHRRRVPAEEERLQHRRENRNRGSKIGWEFLIVRPAGTQFAVGEAEDRLRDAGAADIGLNGFGGGRSA
jgi:hypothetical protein